MVKTMGVHDTVVIDSCVLIQIAGTALGIYNPVPSKLPVTGFGTKRPTTESIPTQSSTLVVGFITSFPQVEPKPTQSSFPVTGLTFKPEQPEGGAMLIMICTSLFVTMFDSVEQETLAGGETAAPLS